MAVSDIPHVLLLLDQGKSMEALELSARLIEEMPTHVTSYVVHARANESQGQYEDAFRSWRQALDLMPNSPQIRKGLMRTAEKLARPAKQIGDDMNWTRDRRQDVLAQMLDQGRSVNADKYSDPKEDRPGARAESRDSSAEIPVFVDTDLPITDTSYELDFSSTDLSETDDSSASPDADSVSALPKAATDSSMSDEASPDAWEGDRTSGRDTQFGTAESVAERMSQPESDAELTWSDQSLDMVSEGDPQDADSDTYEQETLTSDLADKKSGGLDDLDSLIVELESARIVPRPDDDPAPAPDLNSNVDGMVSETLAKIYAAQSQYKESARIFETLAIMHPDRADEFISKAAEMRSKIS